MFVGSVYHVACNYRSSYTEDITYSISQNLFDIPDARKIHTSRVPRLGGIAFVPAIIISIAMIFGLSESDTVIRSGDIAEPSMPFGICGLLFCISQAYPMI